MNRSATTFIIPLIAFLLLIRFAIKNAIVKLHIENTKEFAINISPCAVNIISPISIKLSTTYKNHNISASAPFDTSNCLLNFL